MEFLIFSTIVLFGCFIGSLLLSIENKLVLLPHQLDSIKNRPNKYEYKQRVFYSTEFPKEEINEQSVNGWEIIYVRVIDEYDKDKWVVTFKKKLQWG